LQIEQCILDTQRVITETVCHLSFISPTIARNSHAGQFLHLKIRSGIDPLLRRPLSIHRVDPETGRVELLYRVVGHGTRLLKNFQPGEILDVMGPLGRGFDLTGSFQHALIVAGGMGGAPVFFLIDTLLNLGKKVTLLWGVGDGREIFGTEAYEKQGVTVRISTEDGTRGHRGFVTDLLDEFLNNHAQDSTTRGFVCGPECMLLPVQKRARKMAFEWQASLEEHMACGVGVCQGCGVRLQNQTGYQMVCKDGPVFDLKEIVFDD
jgi:dihydroorotate dehydrogenase electron transfer subunit